MDINYLKSILDLYLKREKNGIKTTLNIHKNGDNVEFLFNTNKNSEDKTSVVITLDEYKLNYVEFINLFKEERMIIDEKYDYNDDLDSSHYYVLFDNGRNISFDGFSALELNNLRNILCNININKEEMRINDLSKEQEMAYKPHLRLQQAGFTSYATLFLTVIFFADVLVIALWIFKLLMK